MTVTDLVLRVPVLRDVAGGFFLMCQRAYEDRYQRALRAKYAIDPKFRIGPDTRMDGDGEIILGPNSYCGCRTTIQAYEGCRVLVGHNVSISHDVKLYTMNRVADQGPGDHLLRMGDVNIGDNCWICAGVMVLEGVSIGEDSVIGAHAVVTHDIPAHSIAAGVPARVIRKKAIA